MHESEKMILRDLPYIILVHDHVIYVTRRDTWHNYQPSPEGDSPAPLTTNWLQLASLEPGPGPDADEVVATGARRERSGRDAGGGAGRGGRRHDRRGRGRRERCGELAGLGRAGRHDGRRRDGRGAARGRGRRGGGMSTGVVILIVLLAMAIGGAIVLMLTRGRRGGREPMEWDE